MSLRALQRRVKRIEEGRRLRPSPIVLWYGSFDSWVESQILPGMLDGMLDRRDMVVVIAALRRWEDNGVWGRLS
ncbi:hypothetical protein SAMN05518866_102162 [Sphingobium sp. YR768]|nr:hypothetical protein SAMN05518866_102162 [Sphingobium sp. YR768]